MQKKKDDNAHHFNSGPWVFDSIYEFHLSVLFKSSLNFIVLLLGEGNLFCIHPYKFLIKYVES